MTYAGFLPCTEALETHDHEHKCGGPNGHGGPEHCCRQCGEWYRRDGGRPTA